MSVAHSIAIGAVSGSFVGSPRPPDEHLAPAIILAWRGSSIVFKLKRSCVVVEVIHFSIFFFARFKK